MINLFWHLVAKLLARPAIADWLIARAKLTPYQHIMSADGSEMYMGRWWLFNPYSRTTHKPALWWCPWSFRIHHIMRPDEDRDLHDHPWNARTIILRGWYTEQRRHFWFVGGHTDLEYRRAAGDTARLNHGEYHRIDEVSHGGVITLFITSKWRGQRRQGSLAHLHGYGQLKGFIVSEPKIIYLGPACEADTGDGRTWAEDNPWPNCECGHRPVQYVLGEIFDRVVAERDALQLRLNAADQRIDEMTVPTGYCLMPTRLTAENGAKALLLGEFKLEVTSECPECRDLEEPSEGCEICDGEGEYGQQHTISWDQIKYIYSEAVKGLAQKPSTPQ